MSEEAAIYRLDVAELQARADALEDLYRNLSVEANGLRVRIRTLEDAILLHKRDNEADPSEADEKLWSEVWDICN